MKFKVLVADSEYFPEESLIELRQIADIVAKKFSPGELKKAIADADAVLIRVDTKLTKDILSNARNLKVIGSATTGLDHIDVNYANEHDIQVVSLQGEHAYSTAEHTFSLV